MVQTAVADPVLREGQIVRGPWSNEIISRVAEGALAAGHLVKYGTDRETQCLELPTLPVADPNAIITSAVLGSDVAAQNIAAATFDGVINRDRIIPCRSVTFTFDASADWNTATGGCRLTVYGYDSTGSDVRDVLYKANGTGAVTITSDIAFATVTRVDVEACLGAAGTADMGVSNTVVSLSPKDYPGIALYESIKEPNTAAREFAQYDDVAILEAGVVAVVVEHAVSVGDDVWVRVVAAGADITGQFTGQDGADDPTVYAHLPNAHYVTAALADAIAAVRLGG